MRHNVNRDREIVIVSLDDIFIPEKTWQRVMRKDHAQIEQMRAGLAERTGVQVLYSGADMSKPEDTDVASAYGLVTSPFKSAYVSAKHGVVGLTKTVALETAESAITCNAICPGTVETPSLHQRLQATGDHDASLNAFIARQPMGRLGTPAEIAWLALYLASDESTFTTGHAHIIDGGWSN